MTETATTPAPDTDALASWARVQDDATLRAEVSELSQAAANDSLRRDTALFTRRVFRVELARRVDERRGKGRRA